MGVSSIMSKTRPKQGSDKKWQDCSNVYKIIEKKALREGWDIESMRKWELDHLCLRLGQS